MKPRLPTRTLIEDGRTLFIVTRGELIEYAKEYADWLEFEGDYPDTSSDKLSGNDAAVETLMNMFGMKK